MAHNPFDSIELRLTNMERLLIDLPQMINPQHSQEQLLTREQTAELLQVDLSTLWHWSKKGKLKTYGIGNRIYYKRSEIEASLIPINS